MSNATLSAAEKIKLRQERQLRNVLIVFILLLVTLVGLAIAYPGDARRIISGGRSEIVNVNPILKCKEPENYHTAFCQSYRGRPEENWDAIRANHGRPSPIFKLIEPSREKLSGK